MAKKKSTKRRADAPVLPPANTKRATRKDRQVALRGRLAVIFERTAAGRREIAAAAAGADMSDLDHLPVVVYPNGRPKPPGLHAKLSTHPKPKRLRLHRGSDEAPPKAPIAAPIESVDSVDVATTVLGGSPGGFRCSHCGRKGHNIRRCPEAKGTLDKLDRIKREAIANAIISCRGNVTLAAAKLGIHRDALQRLLKIFGLKTAKAALAEQVPAEAP